MKSLRPVFAVALAVVVLFSATRFSVGLHFCSGELQKVALFEKAAVCEKEQSVPPCHEKKSEPCCEDTVVVAHDAEQMLQAPVIQHNAAPSLLAALTFADVILAEIIPAESAAQVKYIDDSPPLPSADLTLIHRVFLI